MHLSALCLKCAVAAWLLPTSPCTAERKIKGLSAHLLCQLNEMWQLQLCPLLWGVVHQRAHLTLLRHETTPMVVAECVRACVCGQLCKGVDLTLLVPRACSRRRGIARLLQTHAGWKVLAVVCTRPTCGISCRYICQTGLSL